MSKDTHIIYRVNSKDEFIFFNKEWARFAIANDGAELLPEKILNRTLWEFITGDITAGLYKEIIRRVRMGHVAHFNFRCDSPGFRRFMEMTITLQNGDEVQFETILINEEEREPQELLYKDAPRTNDLIRMCGWCNKFGVDEGVWMEIEDAVSALHLFERRSLPRITHGICDSCAETMRGQLIQ